MKMLADLRGESDKLKSYICSSLRESNPGQKRIDVIASICIKFFVVNAYLFVFFVVNAYLFVPLIVVLSPVHWIGNKLFLIIIMSINKYVSLTCIMQ